MRLDEEDERSERGRSRREGRRGGRRLIAALKLLENGKRERCEGVAREREDRESGTNSSFDSKEGHEGVLPLRRKKKTKGGSSG